MNKKGKDIMTISPVTTSEGALAVEALTIMNDKKITSLLVIKLEGSGWGDK